MYIMLNPNPDHKSDTAPNPNDPPVPESNDGIDTSYCPYCKLEVEQFCNDPSMCALLKMKILHDIL